MPETVTLRIKRQDGPKSAPYWDDFEVRYRPGMNVIGALMDIQKDPVNARGKQVAPVVWDCSCLEEVCGACTMVINGTVRQSCSALVEKLEWPIALEPMTKYPVIRDLWVDRSRIFDDLKRVKAWIPIDGTYDLGPGPRMSQKEQQAQYALARCISCGCCMDACPQYNEATGFVGPAIVNQVRLFNLHPTGKLNAHERLEAVMGDGGIEECGKNQICVQVCPKEIPLTESLGYIQRDTTIYSLAKLFGHVPQGLEAGPGSG